MSLPISSSWDGIGLWVTFAVICWLSACVTPQGQSCKTPNGEDATCISLFDCKVLQAVFASNDPLSKRFVSESQCPGSFVVCCGTLANYTFDPDAPKPQKELTVEEKRNYTLKSILPTSYHCGKQHTDDYFYNATQTSVDEFPWMAYIISQSLYLNSNNKFEQNIGVGALISPTFLLSMNQDYTKAAVKVGQHHILKDKSCISTQSGNDDCTDPSTNIPIRETFTKEGSRIALLKLNTTLTYTDYIRPICLPFKEFDKPTDNDILTTSGWGTEPFIDGQHIQVKKRIKHTMIKQSRCERGNPIPSPICGLTFVNSSFFVCPEDNGGPIMFRSRRNWVAEGIVVGSSSCSKHQPVTGERITQDTINWILDVVYDNTDLSEY